MAPLPVLFYVLALCWAVALSHSDPVVCLAPSFLVALVGFAFHVLGQVQE